MSSNVPGAPAGRLDAGLAGRYTIVREIGRGGMATVYLADDLKHRRQVAIKVLRPEVAALVGHARFLREVEIVARLSHPHILPLHDSGDAEGWLFYVMPYIPGESLRGKLEREKQLSLDEALSITRQVATALAHAHARNVVHRDVKPENILLHEGEAMVADFGVALATNDTSEDRLTDAGLALGTPQYMSPEQAVGERNLDARSDIYSLACVVYEMLAGEPPFTGATGQAVIAKRFSDPVPTVRRIRAVPVAVDQALAKALAKAPADRFASVTAFAEALAGPGSATPSTPSVAVLPFLNLSPDPENEYFADGITEDVIAHLSKIRALRVISRGSVMPFKKREQGLKKVAAQLEVTTLLDGSVRRVGDRVRIVAQLVDAETERYLWSETYDRELTDIFGIQTDVALHIAAALRAELSADEQDRIRKEPTVDLHAYQLYLQGRRWFVSYTGEGMRQAVAYFERATAQDPGYAMAHAAMAEAYAELAENGSLAPEDAYRHAREAAARALELDPTLGEAHCVAAYLKTLWDFDWAGAEQGFRRALELSPSSADTYDLYGRMCSGLGRYDEALRLHRRAQQLDPLAHRMDVATTLLRAGRYEEAALGAVRALELDPEHDRAHATLGWAYLKMGKIDAGVAELEQAASAASGNVQWLAQLGAAYGLTGRSDRAREILARLLERGRTEHVSPYHLAFLYAGLGDTDEAMNMLEGAFARGAGAIYGVKGSFLFASLHGHPRFNALLKKMNLT
ncbi:MAG TPA: protein kinase [Gemmatimonadales bacterium]|nr:protein kinase [Gemmatimonadales bacterium]